MSGHHARPGPRPRPTTHLAIWAIAAGIIVLAAGACSSSTTTTTSPTTSAVAAASAGRHRPTLIGAGSTFDAPFFSVAFARYQQLHPGVTISYAVVGSSAGIAAITAQQVDFGAADVPMTAAEQAAAKGGPITQVPVDLGGEGIAYNLSLPAGARLHLTGPVLAGIYLGQITRWNNPALTALNPGLSLPAAPINVVHRSDGSGTTYIFSNYLSAVSPAWAAKVGTGKTLTWPVGGSGFRAADERAEAGQRAGSGAVVDPDAALVAIQQPGIVQDLQVVADRRLGQVERLVEVTDAGLAAGMRGHQGHQPQPHRVGERLQQRGDLLGLRLGQRLNRQRRAAGRRVGGIQHGQQLRHTSILTDPDVLWQARQRRDIDSYQYPGGCHDRPRAARSQRQRPR